MTVVGGVISASEEEKWIWRRKKIGGETQKGVTFRRKIKIKVKGENWKMKGRELSTYVALIN